MNDVDLSGHTALVTGAGRGLGRRLALRLAASGARVALLARTAADIRDVQSEIDVANGEGTSLALPTDVTDDAAVAEAVMAAEHRLGPVSLLVNNAGRFSAAGRIGEVDPAEWWRELEVNVRGPQLCIHHVLPRMRDRGAGRVINMASMAAFATVGWGTSAYIVSKMALVRLSELVAAETAGSGICVLSIHPGAVRTAMTDAWLSRGGPRDVVPEMAEWFQRLFASGEDAPPEAVEDLVLFLASGGGDPLTGRYLSVEDDWHALAADSARIENEKLYTTGLRTESNA